MHKDTSIVLMQETLKPENKEETKVVEQNKKVRYCNFIEGYGGEYDIVSSLYSFSLYNGNEELRFKLSIW